MFLNISKSMYLLVPVNSYDLTGPAVRYYNTSSHQFEESTDASHWGNGNYQYQYTPMAYNKVEKCWQYTGMFIQSIQRKEDGTVDIPDNGFRIMGYWSSSVRDYYGKKAIKTPDDLKGMTVRTQSSQVQQDFWKACGAVPTSVAWGELYQALQQGVVDSAENDYTSFMLKEHHKTPNGHFICETHHDYTTRLLLMDGNRYDKLTDEQKGWVDEACKKCTEVERQTVYDMFKTSKEKVIADGAEVTNHEDLDIEAFKAIAAPIAEKFAADNNMTAELEMVRNAAK